MGQMANTQGTPGAAPGLSGAQGQQQGLAQLLQMMQANHAAQQGAMPSTGGVMATVPTGFDGGMRPYAPPTGGGLPGLGTLGNGVQSPIGGLNGLQQQGPGVPMFSPDQQGGLNALRAQRQARRAARLGGQRPIAM